MAPLKEAPGCDRCFINWFNTGMQLTFMLFPPFQALFLVSSFFGCYDCIWNCWMGMAVLPPDATSWNMLRNKGEAAYGVKVSSDVDYESFYNV